MNNLDQMFIGIVESYDMTTKLYTISPYYDRGNISSWLSNAILVRNYKGIQQKNIVGSSVLCAIVRNQCYILGVFGKEQPDKGLSINLGNFYKMVVTAGGALVIRKELGDDSYDSFSYDLTNGSLLINFNSIILKLLGGSIDGFIRAKTEVDGSMSFGIDMGAYMGQASDRMTIIHDKDKSQVLIDGEDREFEILHSSRRAASNPGIVTGSKSSIKVSMDKIVLESGAPTVINPLGVVRVSIEDGKLDINAGDNPIIINGGNITIESSLSLTIKGGNITIDGGTVNMSSSTVVPDMKGPFNCQKVCLFAGVPHSGSIATK